MKILVTGAAGFIGSNLSEYLLEKGYDVVGLDNFNDYYSPKLKEFNIETFKDHEKFKLSKVDITDRTALEELFKNEKFDSVVHLAAWAGVTPSVKRPSIYAEVNYVGTNNLAEFSVANNVKNFIFASTSSVYGNLNPTPFKEDMDTSHPAAPYPASKKSAEVLLYTYSLNFDMSVTVLRFFNPLGPKLRPDMALPKLIRCAEYGTEFGLYQNPESTMRDYTYIGDMMKAIEAAVINPHKYEIMNLGNSNPVSLIDMLETVRKVTGKEVKTFQEPKAGQMEVTFADISRAKELLGYNPSTKLDEMVKIYYNWFLSQPAWYKEGDY
jgi:UDP-glucuronate 4-epimerase